MLNNLVAQLGTGTGGGGTAFNSIATVTAAGGETSFTFSSIPQTYKHLQIRGLYRDTATTAGQEAPLYLRYNSSTTGYAYHYLRGDGTSATASGIASTSWMRIDGAGVCAYTTAGTFGTQIIDILDYTSTTKNKTMRAIAGSDANTLGTQYRVSLSSGFDADTTAVSSITIYAGNTAFAVGSTFALYGIN